MNNCKKSILKLCNIAENNRFLQKIYTYTVYYSKKINKNRKIKQQAGSQY